MKVAIAVFVKTPDLSPVKTRLAATLGRVQTDTFFHLAKAANEALLAQAVPDFAAQGISLSAYWAVGEQQGLAHPLWQSRFMQRLHTGEGGLGERMHYVYSTLLHTHDAVLLVGMDSPQNSVSNLWDAAQCLRQNTLVIGPARDGGFYLFGGNTPVPLSRWTAVQYGQDDTLQQWVAALHGYNIHYLNAMTDVDTEANLHQMVAEMQGELLPEQLALLAFVQGLPHPADSADSYSSVPQTAESASYPNVPISGHEIG